MNDLVIVGRYPFPGRKLEGMVQRISNIDTQIENYPRTYLDLYALKYIRSVQNSRVRLEIYTASFLHFWKIFTVLKKARFVYVHSIYFYALVLLPLIFIHRDVRIILDAHGVVPEEIEHSGNRLLTRIMSFVERAAFSRVTMVICVTRKMESFFRHKYPKSRADFLYLPIFTTQVCQPADQAQVDRLRVNLGIPKAAVVILYSGGLQQWQNVDKMLHAVKRLLDCKNCWFIFLTSECDLLNKQVESVLGVKSEKVLITYSDPQELRTFYELADFGFLLRDDHVLNTVANPTKLVEYLYFGIRPIILSENIGDFVELGYEYVHLDHFFSPIFKPEKSRVNRSIALQLLDDSNKSCVSKYISRPTP